MATVATERVSVYDYDEDGHLDDVVTEGITAGAYADASYDAPSRRPASRVRRGALDGLLHQVALGSIVFC